MNDIPIDKFSLRFPDDLEEIYQEELFHHSLKQLRINIVVVTAIYALFGILDVLVTPEVRPQAWFIRYALVVPSALSVLFFSFSPNFKKYQQLAVVSLVLVGAAGIVALIVLTSASVPYFHFAGLLLVFMTSYTAFKLRFLYATAAGWCIIALYELSALWISHASLPVLMTDNFFYISANLMGMFSNYQRELYLRREFLQNRRLKEMQQHRHAEEKERLNEAVDTAVKSLRESEEKFRALAETTTASIIIHRGGKLLYTNTEVQRSTGYTQEELLRMDFWELVHPEHRELVRKRGRARISGSDAPREYEFKVVTKIGEERWCTTAAGPIQYEGAPAIIATLFDITDRRRAEEDRLKLFEERFEEEQRHLREKESLLMELHDGVGGITTNIGILSEVAQKANDLEQAKKTLATISKLSQEGVSEIRNFMRSLDTDKLDWRMLSVEFRNQGTTLLEPHNIDFALETSIDDNMPEMPGTILCVNLFKMYKETLTNVIKHSRATAVQVTLNITVNGIRLVIKDNGIGCRQSSGTGRGLANMQRRAAEMGGTMTLSSSDGACMDLDIPLPLQYSTSLGADTLSDRARTAPRPS